MLRMTLQQYLNSTTACGVDQYVCQIGLGQRMEMYFRLFEQYRGTFRHIQKQCDHREYLRNTEPNIRKQYFTAALSGDDLCLPAIGSFRNLLNGETLNQTEVL